MMKKIISLVLALALVFTFAGCTKANKGRIKYNLKMDKFVTLGEYEGIKIDTNGKEYKDVYSQFMNSDIQSFDFYAKVTEGKLKKGDVANIDYVGKLNGVAFEGGTASNQELELGSNTFISGFEEGLIGAEIGKSIDLNLTFPKDYGNTELAGKAVVFTVKVNHVVIYDKTTEGTLKNGDTVNIDFTGKLNGKEFDGGSAKGYNLVLGSGQFIEGFEEKLVGKKIGDTVDLNLKFPTNYTAELAGKDVVFTVKINYVTAKRALTPEEYYEELDYKSVEEYYDSLKDRTLENIIMTKVLADAEVKKYPKAEKKMATELGKKAFEANLRQYYGDSVTLEYYLTANNMTDEQFEEEVVKNYSEPLMQEEMVIYAIFDKAGLKFEKDALTKKTKEIVASYKSDKVTEKTLKEQNGEGYFEGIYIQEKVVDYLIEKAKIS